MMRKDGHAGCTCARAVGLSACGGRQSAQFAQARHRKAAHPSAQAEERADQHITGQHFVLAPAATRGWAGGTLRVARWCAAIEHGTTMDLCAPPTLLVQLNIMQVLNGDCVNHSPLSTNQMQAIPGVDVGAEGVQLAPPRLQLAQ